MRASKWTPPLPPATVQAKAVRAAGIDRVLAKAVLAGLIRHPAEIARHMEVLHGLKLVDGALGRLFEAVVDLALEDRALDSARLVTILGTSGLGQITTDLLGPTPRPIRSRKGDADPKRASADLDEAIAIMVARPEVDAALANATAEWKQPRQGGGVRTANGTAQRATCFGRAACKSDTKLITTRDELEIEGD